MTNTRRKLQETHFFFLGTKELLRAQSRNFEFYLNAFVNAARSVTFVMQKEFGKQEGFDEWWSKHALKTDESAKKFIPLRDVSVHERSVGANVFSVKVDFGAEGLKFDGKGKFSVMADPLRFDQPIPDHTYVTITNPDGSERRAKFPLVHDFSVIETYEHGSKEVKFKNFMSEASEYLAKLDAVVDEAENRFS